LDDGAHTVGTSIGPSTHRSQSRLRQLLGERVGAQHQHRRTSRDGLGDDASRCLPAGHDVLGFGGHAHAGQPCGHVGRRAAGVVGDKGQPQAGVPGGREGSGHVLDRLRTEIDDAVEVEQRSVVCLVQRDVAAAERRGQREAAVSAARAPRRAVE